MCAKYSSSYPYSWSLELWKNASRLPPIAEASHMYNFDNLSPWTDCTAPSSWNSPGLPTFLYCNFTKQTSLQLRQPRFRAQSSNHSRHVLMDPLTWIPSVKDSCLAISVGRLSADHPLWLDSMPTLPQFLAPRCLWFTEVILTQCQVPGMLNHEPLRSCISGVAAICLLDPVPSKSCMLLI